MMSLLRDIKFVSRDRIFLSRDKSVNLTGVLSCRTILFECLRHNHQIVHFLIILPELIQGNDLVFRSQQTQAKKGISHPST